MNRFAAGVLSGAGLENLGSDGVRVRAVGRFGEDVAGSCLLVDDRLGRLVHGGLVMVKGVSCTVGAVKV